MASEMFRYGGFIFNYLEVEIKKRVVLRARYEMEINEMEKIQVYIILNPVS